MNFEDIKDMEDLQEVSKEWTLCVLECLKYQQDAYGIMRADMEARIHPSTSAPPSCSCPLASSASSLSPAQPLLSSWP
jgi:hypothetical protein